MKKIIIAATAIFAMSQTGFSNPVDELAERLLKTYDSSLQSLYEPDYFDVTLKHCEVNVPDAPSSEADSRFFLLEQAISTFIDRPYRVRLIKISYDASTDTFNSMNFEPSNPSQYAGACRSGETLSLAYENFTDVKCTISMKKIGNDFVGGTPEEGCISTYNGASVFSSEVKITEDSIDSWDRGFDRNGNHVWGATNGPYRFKAVKDVDQSPALVAMGSYLVGHSTNQRQVNQDAENFSLVDYSICPVILEGFDMSRSKTFYVEQKVLIPGREIIRSRVYSLTKEPGVDISFYAYNFADKSIEEGLAGFCDSERPVTYTVPYNHIAWDEPCQMNFQPSDFYNGNEGVIGMSKIGGCPSEFRGSKTLTISATLNKRSFNIWERWWDEDNNQVAGSKKGAYIYERDRLYYYRSFR